MKKSLLTVILITAMSLFLMACSQQTSVKESDEGNSSQGAIGTGGEAVGFIFVGTKDDYGYNQAAYLGSVAVEESFPDLKVLRSENVPETSEAERVMEEMIRNGAKVIFPTSYGHLDPALEVAKRHPDVAFFHQGGLKNAENLGTYFGTIWETVYLSGVAAAEMTESNKLGFIASSPIPQVLLNINAFQLGAQSVNPDITTNVVFTGSWCDPGQQTSAVNSLVEQGVDVVTQHQDCTKTIIEAANSKGIMSVGYHADASSLAPDSWITGSMWNWPNLYVDMVQTAIDGNFKGSQFDGQYRGGLADDVVQLAPFGSKVSEEIQTKVKDIEKQIIEGNLHPFTGPVKDQSGKLRIEEDATPSIENLESMDYLVEGVIGNLSN